MGESYYLRKNICPHCGRYDEIHIGMANLEWKFVFHVDEEHENFSD